MLTFSFKLYKLIQQRVVFFIFSGILVFSYCKLASFSKDSNDRFYNQKRNLKIFQESIERVKNWHNNSFWPKDLYLFEVRPFISLGITILNQTNAWKFKNMLATCNLQSASCIQL